LLREIPPSSTKDTRADKLMSSNILALPTLADMKSIKAALFTSHQGFPVFNTAGNLVGLISKQILVPLVEKKAFYNRKLIG
jgi:hypothetical protein